MSGWGSGDLASQLATELNNARVQNGLRPATRSAGLDQVANARCQDMVNRHYFSHTTPSGSTVLNALQSRGIRFLKVGEVLAGNEYSADQSASGAARDLLNSPEHRAIILDPSYTQFGVGEATNSDGMRIFTAVYIQG